MFGMLCEAVHGWPCGKISGWILPLEKAADGPDRLNLIVKALIWIAFRPSLAKSIVSRPIP